MNLVINLNKPSGITSQQAVSRVKRLLGVKRAGHTGTLDPLATGVLLVCVNEATKISRFLLDLDKTYRVRIKLGEKTDTYDSEGDIIQTRVVPNLTGSELVRAVSGFAGPIRQRPPMYSAVKIKGKALYKLARKGIEVERPERDVTIYDIRILETSLPFVDLFVSCSKGTYVRTLCDDIGNSLGTGAHVVSLAREGIGFFERTASVTFDELAARKGELVETDEYPLFPPKPERSKDEDPVPCNKKYFFSVDEALTMLPEIVLSEADYLKAMTGQGVMVIETNSFCDGVFVKLKGPSGNLFGIGSVKTPSIKIERILHLPFFPSLKV